MLQNQAAKKIFHWLVVVVLLGNLAYGAKVYSESDAVAKAVSYTHLTLPTKA